MLDRSNFQKVAIAAFGALFFTVASVFIAVSPAVPTQASASADASG